MSAALLLTMSLALGASPRAEGRKIFNDPSVGKSGVACAHCHATVKNELKKGDGLIRAGHTLWGVAKRKYWRGDRERRFHANLGDAANVCVQIFQQGAPLQGAQRKALTAYLRSISKKTRRQPALQLTTALEADLDYDRQKYQGGSPTAGRDLFYKACHSCHPHGGLGLGPTLFGKSVPEVARSVREGNGLIRGARRGATWMPAFGLSRLSNEQVADIAAFVASLGS